MKILVTGGAGFIGSALIRHLLQSTEAHVVNVDKLTYAATPEALTEVEDDPRYAFEKVDVCDGPALKRVFASHRPSAVMHLAAESHVDRSIDSPSAFIDTNVVGTYTLLEATLGYWGALEGEAKRAFRFHHISTDEVYGSLGATGLFTEETPYQPNSPYSASKAASDHLVRAWYHTYGLPTVISNCSNNYGPYQFPEKLIPLITINALLGEPLPVYGKGENVRDWLYVEDHARALWTILTAGRVGETYNVGGNSEMRNIEVVQTICDTLDDIAPLDNGGSRRDLITFVEDRPGHDLRYAIDATKLTRDLDWAPQETFASGLRKTVDWYLENRGWWERIRAGRYDGGRLGRDRTADRKVPSPAVAASGGGADPVLVFGAGGQVGRGLCEADNGLRIEGVTHANVDITRRDAVLAAVRDSGCGLVVNAAAYTAVDAAERESEAAFAVNRDGAARVAEACKVAGVPLIHISTDYVFDGTKGAAYREDDRVHPLSVYGESKEAGERAVRATLDRHIILRTSWIFSEWGRNFVRTMLRLADERDELRVVGDQRGCPTAARDVAAAIMAMVPRLGDDPWGTYHYCGSGVTTWYDFADAILDERTRLCGSPKPRLRPIPTSEFPTPARRPSHSELDCSRFTSAFGVVPRAWREGLTGVLRNLLT